MALANRLRQTLHKTVHKTWAEPVLLYVPNLALPISVEARLQDNPRDVGDIKGADYSFAEMPENSPRAIFYEPQFINNASMAAAGVTSVFDVLRKGTVVRANIADNPNSNAFEIDTVLDPEKLELVCELVRLTDPVQIALYPAP